MTWPKILLNFFCVAAIGASLVACDLDTARSIFDPAGPIAQDQLELFMFTFWYGMGVMAIVTLWLIYALWKFRERPKQEGLPSQIEGQIWLEAAWTIAPIIILIIIGVPTVRTIFRTERYVEPEETDLVITAVGHQWWWEFIYPEEEIVTANELHVPVGTRIVLNLESEDVIHSFWVPKLAGKRDLIPNQDNQLFFIAERPGIYNGHCAEYCLGPHAYMRLRVVAHTAEDFEAWQEDFGRPQLLQQDPLLATGEALFKQKGCASCHTINGVSYADIGPNLTNFAQRHTIAAGVLENTPENLARWLRNPDEVKPGNYMPILWPLPDETTPQQEREVEQEIGALVAYLESLGDKETRAEHDSSGLTMSQDLTTSRER
jgi:cytochrome c oxidase subunit II